MARSFRRTVRGALVLVLACAGAAVAAPPAPAAAAVGCGTDEGARGVVGAPSGDAVSVSRADGRTDQFQVFHDPTATRGLPFVWHRAQTVPGGPYGDWRRVSAGTVGPKAAFITAVGNARGGLELFWLDHGGFCHAVQGRRAARGPRPRASGCVPLRITAS
ncbi:hypothetical protein ACFQ2B_04360 [Streptomyces stramineus]